jgi:DNA-binding CsgD family transcriptional regulator
MATPSVYDELLPLVDALAFCAEPLFAINERHRVVFWNKPLEHLLGWTYDDVAGRSCGQVLCGADQYGNRYCADPCPIISIAQRGEAVKHFDLSVRTKGGPSIFVDVTAIRFILPRSKRPILTHLVQPASKAVNLDPPPQPLASHVDARVRELTTREIEVLGLVASGQNAGAIARLLGIAPLTARNHIQHVLEKLELHSKSEAVAFAYRMHLV